VYLIVNILLYSEQQSFHQYEYSVLLAGHWNNALIHTIYTYNLTYSLTYTLYLHSILTLYLYFILTLYAYTVYLHPYLHSILTLYIYTIYLHQILTLDTYTITT